LTRPPIGVLNTGDLGALIGGIVLVPHLYLALPLWAASGMLAAAAMSALYLVLDPLLSNRLAIWTLIAALVGADFAAHAGAPGVSVPFCVVNNLVLTILIIGIANLWAQGGLRARDAAILAAFLAVYDLVSTSEFSLTRDLFHQFAGMPFAPLMAWPVGRGRPAAVGLGDLLMAAVFPLVMRKAFGLIAGIVALASALAVIIVLLVLGAAGWLPQTFPVMTVLGPAIGLQCVCWRHRSGPERTTAQYLHDEPLGHPVSVGG
jgi:hypothetical protein